MLVAVKRQISGQQSNLTCLKKSIGTSNNIILNEQNNIISEDEQVANIFNELFVNVAKGIGKDYTFDLNNHPSLNKIAQDDFICITTDKKTVSKIIDNFSIKKSTGADKISAKILKFG